MFHNGSMRDNLNFKTICPFKQKEQTTRITYENGYYISIYNATGEMSMEEARVNSIRSSLQSVGKHSTVCWSWEIYKLLFLLHNIKPEWIEVDMNVNYHQVSTHKISKYIFKIVIVVDKTRGYQTGFLNSPNLSPLRFSCLLSMSRNISRTFLVDFVLDIDTKMQQTTTTTTLNFKHFQEYYHQALYLFGNA